jgi:hypothetical protein
MFYYNFLCFFLWTIMYLISPAYNQILWIICRQLDLIHRYLLLSHNTLRLLINLHLGTGWLTPRNWQTCTLCWYLKRFQKMLQQLLVISWCQHASQLNFIANYYCFLAFCSSYPQWLKRRGAQVVYVLWALNINQLLLQ